MEQSRSIGDVMFPNTVAICKRQKISIISIRLVALESITSKKNKGIYCLPKWNRLRGWTYENCEPGCEIIVPNEAKGQRAMASGNILEYRNKHSCWQR